jgi:hypothetical protein
LEIQDCIDILPISISQIDIKNNRGGIILNKYGNVPLWILRV